MISTDLEEPLDPPDARKLIRRILESGRVVWTGHVKQRMGEHNLTALDCVNVFRAGVVEPPEMERRSWRYRVRGAHICLVAAFRSQNELVVITAWRITS